MQSKENKPVDTRSFGEIWLTLSHDEKLELTRKLFLNDVCITRQTIWGWATGRYKPKQRLVMNSLVRVLGRFLGRTVSAHTLFPERHTQNSQSI